MACTSLRRLYSLLLITTVIFILYVKIITPLHSSKVILELKAIQGYVRQLENKVSMESLEANDRFKRFVRHMVEQLKPRRLQSFMIIMAQEGSIPWIENFLCSVSQFDLLPRISVFTVDRDTTLSINIKYPMISVFELNFDELLYDTPPEYDTQVRRRLFDIVRLRLAAVLSKNKLDVLIASPNQIWTANLFKRVLYPIMVRKLARHGYELFVQEGENNLNTTKHLHVSGLFPSAIIMGFVGNEISVDKDSSNRIDLMSFFVRGRINAQGPGILEYTARLLSYHYTSVESAVMYICDSPKAFECVLLPKARMSGLESFRTERDTLADIVHIPMSASRQKLVGEGLWLLTPDGKCNSSLLPDLKSTLEAHNSAWDEREIPRKTLSKRTRLQLLHPHGYRDFFAESAISEQLIYHRR